MVDDGSPDDCGAICDEYAKKDNRIRVIHQENRGVSAARNAGIEQSTGELITFMDSDDYIDINTYSENIPLFNSYNVDIIQYPIFRLESDGKINELISQETPEFLYDTKEIFYEAYMQGRFKLYMWNKIYLRSTFDNCRFPEGMFYEDVYILADIISNNPKVLLSNLGCYYYRKRPGQTTQSFSAHFLESKIIANLHVIEVACKVQASRKVVINRYYDNFVRMKKYNEIGCDYALQVWQKYKEQKPQPYFFYYIVFSIRYRNIMGIVLNLFVRVRRKFLRLINNFEKNK